MKRSSSKTLLLAAALMPLQIFAVPAKKGPVVVTQPDGSQIEIIIHGDEFHHFATTKSGAPLVRNDEGFLEITSEPKDEFLARMSQESVTSQRRAALLSSLRPAVKPIDAKDFKSTEGRGPGLFPGTAFPSEGSPKALVILVQYSDLPFTLQNPFDYFSRMINERGFSDYGGTGSAMDYFIENSGGRFTPEFDVYGPVTLPQTRTYYGANDSRGDDRLAYMMAVDACKILDSDVDFSKYDTDGDGKIDNIFIFFAGEGESQSYVPDHVWPHTGFVSYSTSVKAMYDGVQLDRYACSNEWQVLRRLGLPNEERPDGVGTFIHEFSHVMGLPDLYSVKYNNAFTPGPWSVMDYGPYNNDGCTPPNYSAFERYALGWLSPRIVTSRTNVSLEDITTNRAVLIPTPRDSEYFIFENRRQQGWDKYIPGHGMLVWHIDYNEDVWSMNMVNTTVGHQYVDLEEADGMTTEDSRADDAFHAGLNRTKFDDTTIPSMLPWTGRSLNLPISEITERPDGIMTFKVAGGYPDVEIPVPNQASNVTQDSFTASWSEVGVANCSYALSVYERSGASSSIYYLKGYENRNVGSQTSYEVTGLKPDTEYYYTVRTIVEEGESEASEEIAVRTLPPSFDTVAVDGLTFTEIGGDGFLLSWYPLQDATSYDVYIAHAEECGTRAFEYGFDEGLAWLPDGWITDTSTTYGIASNCGADTPSLRYSKSGQYLQLSYFNEDLRNVSFWARGVSNGNTVPTVTIEAENELENRWVDVETREISSVSGGSVITVENLPSGTKTIKLSFNIEKGSVAIDDISLGYGVAYGPAKGEENNIYSTVQDVMLRVRDLSPETHYLVRITGYNGVLTSLPGEWQSVMTGRSSSVATVSEEKITINRNGNRLHISGLKSEEARLIRIDGTVAACVTVKDGKADMEAPAGGFYILSDGNLSCRKIAIK